MSMTKQFQIYKCELCSQVIEVLHAGSPSLICCGQAMKHLAEGTSDGAKEKHIPVIEKTDTGGCLVKVGSVAHPMQDTHWIEWIEAVSACGRREIKFLAPGEAPEATFRLPYDRVVSVREYCNLHGLWKTEKEATESCACSK